MNAIIPEVTPKSSEEFMASLREFASTTPLGPADEFAQSCHKFIDLMASLPPRHVPLEERFASWLCGTWHNATRPLRWALADRLESLERKLRRG